jgi:hypothetical protein
MPDRDVATASGARTLRDERHDARRSRRDPPGVVLVRGTGGTFIGTVSMRDDNGCRPSTSGPARGNEVIVQRSFGDLRICARRRLR